MTKQAWRCAVLTSIVTGAGVPLLACGSSTASSFDGGAFGKQDATTDGALGRDGQGPLGDGSTLHREDGSSPASDGGALDGACAASKTQASLIPAYLIFVMDRSDSMKQYGKWPACTAALQGYSSYCGSDGTSAGSGGTLTASCLSLAPKIV